MRTPPSPIPLARCRIEHEDLSARKSSSKSDREWDAFLRAARLGQFQQSSIWARIKGCEGWKAHRVIVRDDEQIVGGFQILYRKRGLLTEGFLNKGPVYASGDRKLQCALVELVEVSIRKCKIHLLVSQAPDDDVQLTTIFEQLGHKPNAIAKVIAATLRVPLGGASAAPQMRRSVKVDVKRAIQRGTVIREGNASDVPLFFRLMCSTCERQNTKPNPGSEDRLSELWSAFDEEGLARMTIAECEGRPVASLLALRFGDRVTQWKKGWSGEFRNRYPTTLLSFESIEWAEKNGAKCVDFVGCNPAFARALLTGAELTAEQRSSRDFFLLGFGAEPALLPMAQVYIPNSMVKAAYALGIPLLRKLFHVAC